jgi:hypothetical protein
MPEARCSDGGLAPGTQKRGTGAPQLGTPVPQLHLARQQARHDKQPMLPLLQPRSCAALSKSEFTTGHQRPATAGVAGVPRVRAWWAPQTVCVRCMCHSVGPRSAAVGGPKLEKHRRRGVDPPNGAHLGFNQ